MSITAAQVNELRKKTGAGMMDCKKALVEANGDMQKAVDILRKKGAAVAAKRAEKSANEGLILTKVANDKKSAAIVEVNCETDFVAKSEDFESNLWLGVEKEGLHLFTDGRFTTISTKDGLTDDRVWTVAQQANSNIWVGTNSGGINLFKEGKITPFEGMEKFVDVNIVTQYEDSYF